MKKVCAILLALAMMIPVAALADGVIMGSNCQFPPFEFIADDGTPAGFDVEIGKLIAEKLGKEFRVEDMSFDGLLMALDTGSVDFVIAAMTITDERKEQVNFSEPYFEAQQLVIVRKGYEDIKTLEDIQDKMVAVQDGTTGFYMATDTLGLPAERVAAFKNSADAIMELKLGRVDCVIIDTAPAKVFVDMNDDLVILENMETPVENYGIAVKKGNEEVLTACNAVLAEIKESGKYDELIATFFVTEAAVEAK